MASPGFVMAEAPDEPGRLRVFSEPYDRGLVGVARGAGSLQAGAILGTAGDHDDLETVDLEGRVSANFKTEGGPIVAGGLLTTSTSKGHATRAGDTDRTQGSAFGQAMTALDRGEAWCGAAPSKK